MNSRLSTIRQRVERMTVQAVRESCAETHSRIHFSYVFPGDSEPKWPGPDAPKHCACGERLDYRHIIHRYPVRLGVVQ